MREWLEERQNGALPNRHTADVEARVGAEASGNGIAEPQRMNGIALQPKASNRAIARVVGVNRSTIDRDQRGSNEPPTIDKPSPANGASGSNAPPSLTGEPAAGRLSPALREKLAFVIEHDPRSVRADGGIGLDAAREAAAGGLLAGEVIARLTQFLTGSSSEAAAE